MTKRKTTVYASHGVYLDPADCDSTIMYSITGGRRLNGSINLSDCNRKIVWYFGGYDTNNPVAKINAAIDALTKFKLDFISARDKFKKRPRRRKRANKS